MSEKAPETPQETAEQDPAPSATSTAVETPEALTKAEDFKPEPAELVVGPHPRDDNEVFRVLDRHDESQILDDLQARILDSTLYDFEEGGRRMVDLSYIGVREVVHRMNATGKVRIRAMPGTEEVEEIEENGEPHYRATIWAEDLATGAAFPGASHQPKLMKLKDGTAKRWRSKGRTVPEDNKVWDEYAYTKAVNKAARNALKMFVPEPIRQTLIAQYLGDPDRVKKIAAGAGAEAMAELPPPLTNEKAEQQRERCREVYGEIKEIHRTKFMVPGQFNALLLQHEWSHERLDELIEHLEGMLERAREEAA